MEIVKTLDAPTFEAPEIATVPTAEIARWMGRITLINAALDSNNKVMVGGMGDDGILFEYLTDEAAKGEDWKHLPVFEEAILYQMKRGVGYSEVMQTPYSRAAEKYKDRQRLSMELGQAALREGLRRVGLFTEDEPHVPVGAAAALAFRRGNIHKEADRLLYEREPEIAQAYKEVLADVSPRQVVRQVWSPRTEQKKDIKVPFYSVAAWLEPEQIVEAGLDPDSNLDPWWQELQNDLSRIDAAAETQMTSGNS